MIVIFVVIVVFVVTSVVIAVPHIVAIPVCLVAVAVSISLPSYLPAPVPAVISVMIIDYRALISRKAPIVAVVGIVVVSAAVISVVIVPDAVAEARIVPEARFVLPTPLPIFPLALTAQPVVLDIVISALSQPFPIIRVVVSVIASGAVIRVISPIPVLRASGGHDCPQSQS
jgi:hypothetical protein